MPVLTLRRRPLLAGLLALPMRAAAQSVPAPMPMGAIPVVASFSILADLVQQVGEDRVAVRALAGPDQDMHGFEPRPSDIQAVSRAAVMVINGLGLEGWVTRVTKAAGFRGRTVVATQGVRSLKLGHRHGAGGENGISRATQDPHAWQNVAHVKQYVRNIHDGLAAADPAQAQAYSAASERVLARLDVLDGEIRALLAAIPRGQRRVVTSHAAFAYFADAYDVDMLAVAGTWRDSEPSARELAALAAQVRNQRIRALFLESASSGTALRALASETGVRIGGKLYADALSAPGGEAGTYIDMMRFNSHAIAAALR